MAKARILAVDDQLYFRTFLEGLLAEEGYRVETAPGGAEALHALERERFDVVLTDLVMPEMDGGELIRRIKARWPEQEVIIVSGVGDVQTAVDAMKYGATDYLLKPIERGALLRALEQLLTARRLRAEHEQLMAENLEYLGVLSLYERAVGLFSTLALEPLAQRAVETFCLETGAQGGVLWVLREDGDGEDLVLAAAQGLVQVAEEPEILSASSPPPGFEEALAGGVAGGPAVLTDPRKEGASVLWVPLRRGGQRIGLVRLSDKLEGGAFGDRERAVADKAAGLVAQALANALHVRELEQRSFRDPVTKAYSLAYLEDVVRNEIEKSSRFGRPFSLLALELDSLAPLRKRLSEPELGRWLEGVVYQVARALRSTDLVAAESGRRYRVLLPETDALGAAVLKRRVRDALRASDLLESLEPAERPALLLAAASHPGDGLQAEALSRALDERLEAERHTLVRELGLEGGTFASAVDAVLERAEGSHPRTPEQVMRFAVDEVGRRPGDRGLLFLAPGGALPPALREGLERLRGTNPRTEVVLVGEGRPESLSGAPVTCVGARRAGTRAPFVIYYGEGPAYALVQERGGAGETPPWLHTSDRSLVEHLAFQLQRDLGISLSP